MLDPQKSHASGHCEGASDDDEHIDVGMLDPLFWNEEGTWAHDILKRDKLSMKSGVALVKRVITVEPELEAALQSCIVAVMSMSKNVCKNFKKFTRKCEDEYDERETFQRGDDIGTAWASYVYFKTRDTVTEGEAMWWAKSTDANEMKDTLLRGFDIRKVERQLTVFDGKSVTKDGELLITTALFLGMELKKLLDQGKCENKEGWTRICEYVAAKKRKKAPTDEADKQWREMVSDEEVGGVLALQCEYDRNPNPDDGHEPFKLVQIYRNRKTQEPLKILTFDGVGMSRKNQPKKYMPDNVVDMVKDGNCFVFFDDGDKVRYTPGKVNVAPPEAAATQDQRAAEQAAATQDQRAAEQAAATQDQSAAEQAAATQDQAPGLSDMSVDAQPAGGHSNPVSAASSPGASSDDWRARVDDLEKVLKQEENEYEALQEKKRKIYDDMIQVDEQLRKKANVISSRKIEMARLRAQEELEALKKQNEALEHKYNELKPFEIAIQQLLATKAS